MKKILIIDDDRVLRQTLAAALEAEGYGVAEASDGREGLNKALKTAFDLVVLDVVMPALGGLEVCRKLREAGRQVPLIVMSGKKKKEIDKVLGLELGGDDYLTKPFGTDEFIARVHAVLRRSRPEVPEIEDLAFGDVVIDFQKKTATKAGRDLHLTAREFSLLRLSGRLRGPGRLAARPSSARSGNTRSSPRRGRSTPSCTTCGGRSRTTRPRPSTWSRCRGRATNSSVNYFFLQGSRSHSSLPGRPGRQGRILSRGVLRSAGRRLSGRGGPRSGRSGPARGCCVGAGLPRPRPSSPAGL
ncbi:MAG: response regulator transcription factor [Sphingobacterium sp.]|nr:response regulator transcription factor [Sphingobacterium sp.]